ncbi:translocation/assembly module TamB domain-containing protein [Desulforhopalus sp. 52FAK]
MAQTKPSLLRSPALKIGLGVLFILLLIVLFIPQLSSTSFVSEKIKAIISEKVPGQVDFSNIELSWTKGLHIANLQYQDQLQGIIFTVDDVSTSKGLFTLATNYKDGGVINITRPQARITIPEKEVSASETIVKPAKKVETPSPQTVSKNKAETEGEPSKTPALPTLPPINVQINITEGSLITVEPGNVEKSIIENLDVHLKLDGPAGALNYKLSFNNGQAAGTFTGEGDLVLPQGGAVDLKKLESQANISISEWQIADFLDLAASRADSPEGEGLLNGTLQLTGKGVSALTLTGNLTGSAIKLHGGPLLSDTPSIEEFTVHLNAITQNDNLEIEALKLNSPFATVDISAKARDNILQTLTAKGKIDIAEIFSQFPATLNLQKDMQVSDGMIDIDANLTNNNGETLFNANGHLKRLIGTAGKKKISLNQPVDINIAGSQNNKTINLDNLAMTSSFLTAKGSGNSSAMQLNVKSDIDAALKELGKFIDLDGLESGGKLNLTLTTTGNEANTTQVTGNLLVDGFRLSYDKAEISPKDTLSVNFASELLLENNSILKEIRNTRLQFASWLGQGTVTANSIVPSTKETPGIIKQGHLKGNFDLDRLTTLLHSMESLPKEQHLSGPLKLTAKVDGENIETPTVHFSLNASPFTYTSSGKKYTDDSVNMEVDAHIDLIEKKYDLKNLTFASTPVALASKGEMLTKNKEQYLTADGKSTFDLKVLSQQLQSYADLNLEMTGVSSEPFELQTNTKGGQWTEIPKVTEFSTSFHADTIVGYGLNITSLDLPIRLKDSIGAIDFNAKVNNGLMTLKPTVDFSGDYPVASLPENSSILKDVELTEDMANDLLSKVHPLFKGAATTSGKVNLNMKHMSWPVGQDQQKDVSFTGAFIFDKVQLQAGSLLSPLLTIMKTDEDSITLSNEPMTFTGANGRVTCSALTASINEYYSIIFEGSVGFDQSLDYVVKIPVTRKMVSSKIYKYLEGTYITVPISGTVSKPAISKSFVQKALGDLALQAGTKELGDQAGKLLQNLFK